MSEWRKAVAELERGRVDLTLEEVFTSPQYMGVVKASPVQRAVCRVIEGRMLGDLATHPDVIKAMGDLKGVMGIRPREFLLCAGIRSGKSRLAAACIAWAALTVPDLHLPPGDIPHISVVSLRKTLAWETFNQFLGAAAQSPVLSHLVGRGRDDSYYLTNPKTGRKTALMVVANAEDGGTLISVWQKLVIFDEVGRMSSEGEGKITYEGSVNAVVGRVLSGGMLLSISSPKITHGRFYDLVTQRHGKAAKDLVVAQCTGPMMNPEHWTPERCEEVKEKDPEAYITDVLGQFSSPQSSFITIQELDKCTRYDQPELPPDEELNHVAAIDPAMSRNAFTLVLARQEGEKRRVVLAREWMPPFNFKAIFKEIWEILAPYGVKNVATDQYANEILRQIAKEVGLNLFHYKQTHAEANRNATAVQARFRTGDVEIPYLPQLRTDLMRAEKIPLPGGGYRVNLPQTPDGRHCDFVPALLIAIGAFCKDERPTVDPRSLEQRQADEAKRAVFARVKKQNSQNNRIKRWFP